MSDDKQQAIAEAARLFLVGTQSFFHDDDAARASDRALELGATYADIQAEIDRQRKG